MQFDSFVKNVLSEMARMNVQAAKEAPPYAHSPETLKAGEQVQKRYGVKEDPQKIHDIIQKTILDLSADPSISEIESADLTAALSRALNRQSGGPFAGTSAEAIAKRAVSLILKHVGGQSPATKQQVANVVAVTAKVVANQPSPEKAEQAADRGADKAVDIISQGEPQAADPTPQPESQTAPQTEGESKDVTSVLDKELSLIEPYYDEMMENVANLNKKATKKGIPLINVEKLGEEMVTHAKSERKNVVFKKIKFRIQVPQLQLPGGWKFIGRVDHEAIGNLIVSVPNSGHEEDLHKLYGNSQPSYCDHCHTTRKRTSTFVVQDENGNLKRIGRQCLKDYLPGGEQGVQKMLDYAEYLSRLAQGLIELEQRGDDGGGEEGGGGGWSRYSNFRIKEALGLGLAYVRKLGYISKSKANAGKSDYDTYFSNTPMVEPTSTKVINGITGHLEDAIARAGGPAKAGGGAMAELNALTDYRENKEKYDAEADQVIEWGKNYIAQQLERPSNMTEYFKNLQTILNGAASSGSIPEKYMGYLLSIIPAYNKAIEAKDQDKLTKERGEQVSEYVGSVGAPIGELSPNDRRKLKKSGVESLDSFPYNGPIPVTVTGSRSFERQGFGYYDSGGTTTMINMIDDNGNVYVYFANNGQEVEKGTKLIIKRALVKNHKDYTNKNTGKVTKQTVLTRAILDDVQTSESVSFSDYYKNSNK